MSHADAPSVASSLYDYSDTQIIKLFNNGSSIAFTVLANRYLSLIHAIASKYRIEGLDADDLTQEGLLGLLAAVKTYDIDKGASFRTYAGLCVNRRFITLLKRSVGSSCKPLNDYVSLYDDGLDENRLGFSENPEEQYIENEALSFLQKSISDSLSKKENQVLTLYLAGDSYTDIADKLQLSPKSVDNALQRIRKKLRKHISNILP